MSHRLHGAVSVLALSVLGLQVASPAFAAPPLPAPEPSFMGIRLLASFRDVLKRFGQPQEIQIGDPSIPGLGAPQIATPGSGGLAMGGPPMSGSPYGGVAGGGPRAGMGMGMPGSGGLPTFPGGRMGGGLRQDDDESERGMMGGPPRGMGMPGSAGGLSGAPAGLGGSPFMGMPMAGGSALSGLMGTGMPGSGGPVAAGASGPAGIPGFAGATGGIQTQEPPGETTWWYYDKKVGTYRAFLFNKEGRVIQIQLFGYKGKDRTRRGIGLGSSLDQVIRRYGWSNDGYRTGDAMMLKYGGREQLAFQLSKNRVVGITLAYVKQ